MNTFHIFHGWGGNSQSNWFENTRQYLADKNQECHVPDFPNSQFPVYKEWKKHIFHLPIDKGGLRGISSEDKLILIGHSLGCGFIQRLLTEEDIQIDAAILIAPTVTDCGISEIGDFFTIPFDYKKIKSQCEQIYIIASDDDPFIPVSEVELLGKKLNVNPLLLENREHLWQPRIPELEKILETYM